MATFGVFQVSISEGGQHMGLSKDKYSVYCKQDAPHGVFIHNPNPNYTPSQQTAPKHPKPQNFRQETSKQKNSLWTGVCISQKRPRNNSQLGCCFQISGHPPSLIDRRDKNQKGDHFGKNPSQCPADINLAVPLLRKQKRRPSQRGRIRQKRKPAGRMRCLRELLGSKAFLRWCGKDAAQ